MFQNSKIELKIIECSVLLPMNNMFYAVFVPIKVEYGSEEREDNVIHKYSGKKNNNKENEKRGKQGK